MKSLFGIVQGLILLAVPTAISTVLTPLPSRADSLSFSGSDVEITDFSHPAIDTSTITDTNTETFADSGQAIANAEALAGFPPSEAGNFSIAAANGNGDNYSGLATSFARVLGIFSVEAKETFSFNFASNLLLNISTDLTGPSSDFAAAAGLIQFQLFNDSNNNPLDSFSLFAQLDSSNPSSNAISFSPSSNITLNLLKLELTPSGTSTVAKGQIAGTYSRLFEEPLILRLQEEKFNGVKVASGVPPVSPEAVPVPSEIGGTVLACLGLIYLRRRQLIHRKIS